MTDKQDLNGAKEANEKYSGLIFNCYFITGEK